MAKRTPNYILVVLMLMGSIAVTYWAHARPYIAPLGADLRSLPVRIGDWSRSGDDWTPDEETLNGWIVEPKDFLSRTYVTDDGASVNLMVVYKGFDRRGWHLSEMCFSGSGYNVAQTRTRVFYGGRDVSAVKLVAENPNDNSEEIAVYLLARGRETESNFARQQVSMALTRLRPSRYGWAFIRVTTPVTGSRTEALRQIRRFFKDASSPLERALTTPPNRAAPVQP